MGNVFASKRKDGITKKVGLEWWKNYKNCTYFIKMKGI